VAGNQERASRGVLPSLLLAVALIGCVPQQAETGSGLVTIPPAPAGEAVRVPIPAGWSLGRRDAEAGSTRFEYRPAGQTAEQWTETITVSIIDRQAAPSVSALVKDMDRQFRSGADCAVPPTVEPPIFLRDRGHTDGTQSVACGRSRRSGQGEYTVIRTIEGKDAYYQLQRTWQLPAAAATSALSGTPEMHKTGLRFVVKAFLCDNRLPAGRC
jgi:hypothetical protein